MLQLGDSDYHPADAIWLHASRVNLTHPLVIFKCHTLQRVKNYLDNANKVIFDSLKGLTFADDKWVREIHARRMEPDGVGRVVIRITELEHYRRC